MSQPRDAGAVTGGRENSPFDGRELRERLPEPGAEYPVPTGSVRSRLPASPRPEEEERHE